MVVGGKVVTQLAPDYGLRRVQSVSTYREGNHSNTSAERSFEFIVRKMVRVSWTQEVFKQAAFEREYKCVIG